MPGLTEQLIQYAPLVLMLIFFYFFLYRPQKKKQQEHAAMLDSLKKGDRIIALGGLYGTILAINDKVITLRVAEKTDITIGRHAVNSRVSEIKDKA